MFRRIGLGYVVKETTRRDTRVLGVFESRDLAAKFCEERLIHYHVHREERWERKGLMSWAPVQADSCGRNCAGACDLFAPGITCRPEGESPVSLGVSEVPRWGLPH